MEIGLQVVGIKLRLGAVDYRHQQLETHRRLTRNGRCRLSRCRRILRRRRCRASGFLLSSHTSVPPLHEINDLLVVRQQDAPHGNLCPHATGHDGAEAEQLNGDKRSHSHHSHHAEGIAQDM